MEVKGQGLPHKTFFSGIGRESFEKSPQIWHKCSLGLIFQMNGLDVTGQGHRDLTKHVFSLLNMMRVSSLILFRESPHILTSCLTVAVSGFASFPASDSQPKVARPMSVNPFTVSIFSKPPGGVVKASPLVLTLPLLPSRGMFIQVEGRRGTLSSDPPHQHPPTAFLLLHPPPHPPIPSLGTEGEVNLRSRCHFNASGVFSSSGREGAACPVPPPFLAVLSPSVFTCLLRTKKKKEQCVNVIKKKSPCVRECWLAVFVQDKCPKVFVCQYPPQGSVGVMGKRRLYGFCRNTHLHTHTCIHIQYIYYTHVAAAATLLSSPATKKCKTNSSSPPPR